MQVNTTTKPLNQNKMKADNKNGWGFCETPDEKCTMNYCDENGCQNRKRFLIDPEPLNQNKMTAVEFLERQYNFNKQLFKSDFKQAYKIENDALQEHWEDCENGMKQSIYWNNKEMEKEQKILLVEELKAYTKEAQCILGNDEREASEFVDIFYNKTFKSE